jgi:RHS repeat-associated protein
MHFSSKNTANTLNIKGDYYPFGSLKPSRNASTSDYRYGFGGQEMDNEIKGITGSSYSYTFRMYDPRLGRWLSIDPLANKFPFYSPYQFAGNSPIRNVDLEGAEDLPNEIYNKAKTLGINLIKKVTAAVVAKVVEITVDYAAEKTAEKIKENTTPAQQQVIGLTGEFFAGVGDENRSFGPNDPITQDLMKSKYTDQVRQEFYETNKDALSNGDFGSVKPVTTTNKFTGVLTEGGNAQQFVGSATIDISLNKDNKTLDYTIYNETSKNSLMYNGVIPGVDATSHSRDENPAMGTTSQTYTASEPLKTKEK